MAVALLCASHVLAQPPPACGPAWRLLASPNVGSGNTELYDVAPLAPDDIWASGRYSTASGYRTLAMHYDGAGWTVEPTPNPGSGFNHLFALSAVSPTDVWAVGASADQTLITMPMIQHWDGSAWSVVPSPLAPGTSGFLYGVAAVSATDVWAVGYVNVGTAAQLTLGMHWDGTDWTVVTTPNPTLNRDVLWTVEAVSTDEVWAIGNLDLPRFGGRSVSVVGPRSGMSRFEPTRDRRTTAL